MISKNSSETGPESAADKPRTSMVGSYALGLVEKKKKEQIQRQLRRRRCLRSLDL